MTLEDFRLKYGYDAVTLRLLVARYMEITLVDDDPEVTAMRMKILDILEDLRSALNDGVWS
jgi:hypothetical protein